MISMICKSRRVSALLLSSMAAAASPSGGFGLALLRGNSLLSNERQDDPVTFDGEEWQLSTVLGTGTSSTVFAARKTGAQDEPTRAVKVIMVELMGTFERAELRLEYELWSQLRPARHPDVWQQLDGGEVSHRPLAALALASTPPPPLLSALSPSPGSACCSSWRARSSSP